jgi:hypothetical protein
MNIKSCGRTARLYKFVYWRCVRGTGFFSLRPSRRWRFLLSFEWKVWHRPNLDDKNPSIWRIEVNAGRYATELPVKWPEYHFVWVGAQVHHCKNLVRPTSDDKTRPLIGWLIFRCEANPQCWDWHLLWSMFQKSLFSTYLYFINQMNNVYQKLLIWR